MRSSQSHVTCHKRLLVVNILLNYLFQIQMRCNIVTFSVVSTALRTYSTDTEALKKTYLTNKIYSPTIYLLEETISFAT